MSDDTEKPADAETPEQRHVREAQQRKRIHPDKVVRDPRSPVKPQEITATGEIVASPDAEPGGQPDPPAEQPPPTDELRAEDAALQGEPSASAADGHQESAALPTEPGDTALVDQPPSPDTPPQPPEHAEERRRGPGPVLYALLGLLLFTLGAGSTWLLMSLSSGPPTATPTSVAVVPSMTSVSVVIAATGSPTVIATDVLVTPTPASSPTPSLTPTPSATPSPTPTPTPTLTTAQAVAEADRRYGGAVAAARRAEGSQAVADWQAAVDGFEAVFALRINYPTAGLAQKYVGLAEDLAGSHSNLALLRLRQAEGRTLTIKEVEAIRDSFKRAVEVAPARTSNDKVWLATLESYLDGREAIDAVQWQSAVAVFENRDVLPFEFDGIRILDLPGQLYRAYLGQEGSLTSSASFDDRSSILEQALALEAEDVDVREARDRLAALPTPVPPTVEPSPTRRPQPAARRFRASVGASFPGTGKSGSFNSCIRGRVVDRNGRGVAAAVGAVNNGQISFDWTTDSNGVYNRCGLGPSNWASVLFFVPGQPPLGNQPNMTVYVNGDPAQQAIVNFQEQ